MGPLGTPPAGFCQRPEDPAAVRSVVELLQTGVNVAVMCVCADVSTCHRRVVAELALEQLRGLAVIDL